MKAGVLLPLAVFVCVVPGRAPGQPTYSSNVVGFVNLSLPATNGAAALLANPLRAANDEANTVLLLPDSADGTTLYKFDLALQAVVEEPGVYFGGFGWVPANLQLPPGEGFWTYPRDYFSASLAVTFVGEVPAHTVTNRLPAANRYALLASQIPAELPIGDARTTNTLRFPAEDGDTIYLLDPVTQSLKAPFTYYAGFGWSSANPDDPGPKGPVLPLASSFFVLKGPGATQTNWFQQGVGGEEGPGLHIEFLAGSVAVSLTTPAPGYVVQRSPTLAPPTWTDVGAPPVIMPVFQRQAYFRLMRP